MVKQKEMLQEIMMLDFAVIEATLFLDTHPSDDEASKYHQEACNRLKIAQEKYLELYGPLNNQTPSDKWDNYIYSAWPWEVEK